MYYRKEKSWENELRKALRAFNVHSIKISGALYQESGIPDLYVYSKDRNLSVWIEIKLLPKKPTPKQEALLNRLPNYALCISFNNYLESGDHEIYNYNTKDKLLMRTIEQMVHYILSLS